LASRALLIQKDRRRPATRDSPSCCSRAAPIRTCGRPSACRFSREQVPTDQHREILFVNAEAMRVLEAHGQRLVPP